jgi:4-aminobutyrate aminotransferase/(S)-3-amino-2-methylpropionate transaminase
VTGRAEIMDSVHVGGLGGTYGGNPVAAAAALAVIDKIEGEGLLERAGRVGTIVMERFATWADRFPQVGDVRGRGAMCAVELVSDRATKEPLDPPTMGRIVGGALTRGVLVLTAGTYGNVIRLLPPINIDEALLADGLDQLEAALADAVGA